jgi:hypothetical protein
MTGKCKPITASIQRKRRPHLLSTGSPIRISETGSGGILGQLLANAAGLGHMCLPDRDGYRLRLAWADRERGLFLPHPDFTANVSLVPGLFVIGISRDGIAGWTRTPRQFV